MSKIKVALAGNPNVGKSTIFNALTGLRQHTGNWPGKTVGNAIGEYDYKDNVYEVYDLPGTYSLIAHSNEELVARDFICSSSADLVVVVCDAMCLERNLNLVIQILEITKKVVVVVNLMDEASKKGIEVDLNRLSQLLDVPVIGCVARDKIGLDELKNTIYDYCNSEDVSDYFLRYSMEIEDSIIKISRYIDSKFSRFISLKLLLNEFNIKGLNEMYNFEISDNVENQVFRERDKFKSDDINFLVVGKILKESHKISRLVVNKKKDNYLGRMREIDKILTNKLTGIPIMLMMLFIIFWLTITFSNYPSSLLSNLLFNFENTLYNWLSFLPFNLDSLLVHGVYKTVAWVVSVMLPPMMIFFPLFTILEDLGVLPRIAFNLDGVFQKCNSCGKQALTMCMGIGCNAVGVMGCRIIDSPRERLIAILTNCFMPCNGRYPGIIAIITVFFVANRGGIFSSIWAALLLVLVILVSIIMTFIVSKVLSKTLLCGRASSFILELPMYRKPKIVSIFVRSILDRTLFVLGRAVSVAVPCGVIIWFMINIQIDGVSLLKICSNFFDTFGYLIGVDGVIILAFILGIPANEIVIPIILMAYLAASNLVSYDSLDVLRTILVSNGWTLLTALCFIILSVFHYPCATTLLTIKKETKSWYWTFVAFILPTVIGILLCFVITSLVRLFMLL